MQTNTQNLIDFINSLEGFVFNSQTDGNYYHMGATVVHGVLQAGLKYDTVVKPRVDSVLDEYPDYKTSSLFLNVCKQKGIKNIISWKDDRKPDLIMYLLQFFSDEGIETCDQLSVWLDDEKNTIALRSIRGIHFSKL